MTTGEEKEIEVYLQKMRLLYETIQRQQKQKARWQDVAEARKEYERCIAFETQKLRELHWAKDALVNERSRLQWSGRHPRKRPDTDAEPFEPSPAIEYRNPAPLRQYPLTHGEGRQKFKKLINRHSYRLQLGGTRKAEMNQMAEDPHCPLGAALIKLDWDRFETFMRDPSTSSSIYHPVMQEWIQALEDFQQQLDREIRYMELRLKSFSGIAKHWQQDHQLWDTIISNARATKQKAIEELKAEINALHQEITSLKRHCDASYQ